MTQELGFSGSPEDNPSVTFMRDPAPPAMVGLPNYLINTSSLALIIQDTLFRYRGHGPEVAGTITYPRSGDRSGMFGMRWRFSYESEVVVISGTVHLFKGSGQVLRYGYPLSPGQPGEPVELMPLDNQSDRLLDYGTYWLFIEKRTYLMYRYNRQAGISAFPLSSLSDPNGNTITAGYSPAGPLETLTDSAGRVIRFQTDSAGRCISLVLPDGRSASFRYDNAGRLSGTTDLEGIPSEYAYDPAHRMVSMIVAKDRKTTRFTYLARSGETMVSSVTDAVGSVTRYDLLSPAPCRVQVTDAEGNVTVYQSTARGLTETIENQGMAVRFTYDGQDRRTSATTRTGQVTRFEYDPRGNVTRVTHPDGTQTSCSWNDFDRLVSLTDPLGNVTRILYDDRQNMVALITASGFRHSYTYDQLGRVVTYTTPAGRKHTFTYDRFGNLASHMNPAGGRYSVEYDASGLRLTGFVDAAGSRTTYTHDNNGRLSRVLFADGTSREHTYGCCAGLSTKDENSAVRKFVRDPRLLITEFCDAAGMTTRFTYDKLHRLTSVSSPLGAVTAMAISDQDGTVRVTDPTGNAVINQFDPDGNLVSVSDPEGALFRYIYDSCGWLAGCSDACGGSDEYQRDAAGRITSIRSGSGGTRDFVYDPDGRVIQKKHNGSVFATYGYDNDGNLISLDDRTGRTTCSRDACGQVSAVMYPDGKTVSFTYDPAGNATLVRYPDGTDVEYTYDSRERIVSVRWGSGGIRFTYDPSGNVTRMTRSNGVETTCRYTADNSPVEIRHARGNELLAHFQYTRDANRNVTEERTFLPFQPDPASRSFSARCNRIGQIVSWDARAFTYNSGGCLTANGTGQWEAAYDPENRLIRVARGGRVQEFTYNGLGQRTGILSEAGNRILHYDLFGRLLFETDLQGTVVSCYIYAGNLLLARQRPGSGSGFYHFDKTGNTICITGSAGNVEAAYAYDAHGLVSTNVEQNPDKNLFTFVGKYGVMDDGEGLFLMKRRHYDAVTGRFLQRDPVGILGGLNLYAYAANNPVTVIDPEGTDFGITLAIISLAAVFIGVAAYAKKTFTPKNNTIIRALDAANQASEGNLTPEQVKQTIGPDPGQHAVQEIVDVGGTVADKAIGLNPAFGPGYKVGKAIYLGLTDRPGEALVTGVSAFPLKIVPNDSATVGQAAGAIKNVVGAVKNCNTP